MRKVVVLSNSFPYGKSEQFLFDEASFHNRSTLYIPINFISKSRLRPEVTTKNIYIPRKIDSRKILRFLYRLYSFPLVLFSEHFYQELIFLFCEKKLNLYNLVALICFLEDGILSYIRIYRYIRKVDLGYISDSQNGYVFYAYWFHVQAFIAIKLKHKFNNSISVSRAHRYDLFEDDLNHNYIPLRKYIVANINQVFSISKSGLDYLSQNYENVHRKVTLSRLGTFDFGWRMVSLNPPYVLVSCSAINNIKRVDKIFRAIEVLNRDDIIWIHFGTGPNIDSLLSMYKTSSLKCKENVKIMGYTDNNEIHEFYNKNIVHYFINMSLVEGIPVSIMEAMSHGIPALATNVGSTNELVNNSNGYLVDKDITDLELADKINHICNINQSEYEQLRISARENWFKDYDAKRNYDIFNSMLNSRLFE